MSYVVSTFSSNWFRRLSMARGGRFLVGLHGFTMRRMLEVRNLSASTTAAGLSTSRCEVRTSFMRSLTNAWQQSLKTAKDLQEGKEVGRIGFYAPDIVIKGNMIESITGFGYLYPKPK